MTFIRGMKKHFPSGGSLYESGHDKSGQTFRPFLLIINCCTRIMTCTSFTITTVQLLLVLKQEDNLGEHQP